MQLGEVFDQERRAVLELVKLVDRVEVRTQNVIFYKIAAL